MYFGSSWLMLTGVSAEPAEPEVIAARADVADRDRLAARQLALQSTEYCCTRGAVLFWST
jgi:hypothetical protein